MSSWAIEGLAPTAVIGRRLETDALVDLLVDGERLTTLVGVGGIGKTTLAKKVATRSVDQFNGRVFIVELAAVANHRLVAHSLLDVLGVDPRQGAIRDPLTAAAQILGEESALLVLDNCEHLLEGVGRVVECLLGTCPALQVLATSRIALSVANEMTWLVPPLSTVAPGPSTPSPAARLFIARASDARAGSRQGRPPSESLAERIVTALDGVPLAIALAAARTRTLPLHAVAEALDDRLRLLGEGPSALPPRHRAMRASLDWSAQLLDHRDRLLLARLSVFVGGFSLAGAAAVGDEDPLDGLQNLVEASLIIAERIAGTTRFRMLEFVRQYANELLYEEERAEAARRHREYFASLARSLKPDRWSFTEEDCAVLEADAPNLQAALDEASTTAHDDALVLAAFLGGSFWRAAGRTAAGVEALCSLLESRESSPSSELATAQNMLGCLAFRRGDWRLCEDAANAALKTATAVGDDAQRARALSRLGVLASVRDPKTALDMHQRARELAMNCGDRATESDNLTALTVSLSFVDDRKGFWEVLPRAISLATSLELASDVRWCCAFATRVAVLEGNLTAAREYAEHQVPSGGADAQDGLLMLAIKLAKAELEIACGNLAAGRALTETSSAELGVEYSLHAAYGSHCLALAALSEGDWTAVHEYADRVIQPHQIYGHTRVRAHVLHMRASLGEGDTAAARAAARTTTSEAFAMGSRWAQTMALAGLGHAQLLDGELVEAEKSLHEALRQLSTDGWTQDVIAVIELLAWADALAGRGIRAGRLLGAARTARQTLGLGPAPELKGHADEMDRCACACAGDERFQQALADGRELDLDGAVEYARRGRGSHVRESGGWGSLTRAERYVAELASNGLSNPQIGEAALMSQSTVKTHLARVYAKLEVVNRVELAAAAQVERLAS